MKKSKGLSFIGALLITFIVLKLVGVITWIWILSLLWLAPMLISGIVFLVIVCVCVVEYYDSKENDRL